jgi:hypothetical protein
VLVVGVRIQRSSHNAFEFSVQGTYTGKCLFPLELEEHARPRLFHGVRVPAHYGRSLERPPVADQVSEESTTGPTTAGSNM